MKRIRATDQRERFSASQKKVISPSLNARGIRDISRPEGKECIQGVDTVPYYHYQGADLNLSGSELNGRSVDHEWNSQELQHTPSRSSREVGDKRLRVVVIRLTARLRGPWAAIVVCVRSQTRPWSPEGSYMSGRFAAA